MSTFTIGWATVTRIEETDAVKFFAEWRPEVVGWNTADAAKEPKRWA